MTRIVVDSSAIMCVLLQEPAARTCHDVIVASESRLISTGTLIETQAVAWRRKKDVGLTVLDAFLADRRFEIVAVDAGQAALAREGLQRFGGILNFGDLFAYALARSRRLPLLFKGDNFSRTDVAAVPWIGAGARLPNR